MRALAAIAIVAASVTIAQKPRASAQTVGFEVVSIKRNTSNPNGGSSGCRAGRFSMVNGRIESLIDFAYPRENPDLIGAPSWVRTDPYDVDARAAGGLECDAMRPTMRTLLAERLKLAAHYASKEEDIFALVLARSDGRLGPQIRRSELDCEAIDAARRAGQPVTTGCGMSAGPGALRFTGVSISRLTTSINRTAGRFIIDKTGLQGNYDYSLEYAQERALALGNPNNLPNIFTALQEQLGLKLQPERAVLRSLVIDHIERPSDN